MNEEVLAHWGVVEPKTNKLIFVTWYLIKADGQRLLTVAYVLSHDVP